MLNIFIYYYNKFFQILEKYFSDIFVLFIRYYAAKAFFSSGYIKLLSFFEGNWDITIELFTSEHPVPFLPPKIAAIVGTGGEIIFPILLVLGLFSRLAALGLLIMTLIIELTYMHSVHHLLWGCILIFIILHGAGKISLDNLINIKSSKKILN